MTTTGEGKFKVVSRRPPPRDEVTEGKAAYHDCKKLSHSEEHFAVKRLHALWPELANRNNGSRSSEQSKEIRELEAQLKFLRGMDTEDEET